MANSEYSIQFTEAAYEDMDNIYTYISRSLFAPVAAFDLMESIEKNILRLADHPLSGHPSEDSFLKKKRYRKLIVDNFIVFHIVDQETKQVIIMRVLYGPMDYVKLL